MCGGNPRWEGQKGSGVPEGQYTKGNISLLHWLKSATWGDDLERLYKRQKSCYIPSTSGYAKSLGVKSGHRCHVSVIARSFRYVTQPRFQYVRNSIGEGHG